jgi:hypothetical protein
MESSCVFLYLFRYLSAILRALGSLWNNLPLVFLLRFPFLRVGHRSITQWKPEDWFPISLGKVFHFWYPKRTYSHPDLLAMVHRTTSASSLLSQLQEERLSLLTLLTSVVLPSSLVHPWPHLLLQVSLPCSSQPKGNQQMSQRGPATCLRPRRTGFLLHTRMELFLTLLRKQVLASLMRTRRSTRLRWYHLES